MFLFKIILNIFLINASAFFFNKTPKPKKIDFKIEKHGDIRSDNYFWMKERDSKDVLDHIESENKYADKILSRSKEISNTLFDEMKARIKKDDSTAPYQKGGDFYYKRFENGKEYPIYCRKIKSLEAQEEVILDVNELANGKKYYHTLIADFSEDQTLLAFAVDEVGRRFYTIYFKDLKNNKILPNKIENTTGDWVWLSNTSGYYLKQNPKTLRSEKVFKYALGVGASEEVYFEKDELFDLGLEKSITQNYIFLYAKSFNSSEYRYLKVRDDKPKFSIFLKREKNHDYQIEDGGDGFYIRTNWQAENFKIMKAPYGGKTKKSWQTLLNLDKKSYLEDFIIFKKYIVIEQRNLGLVNFTVLNRLTKKTSQINFPDPVYSTSVGINENFDSKYFRYSYSSLVQPQSTYDFDFEKNESRLVKTLEVPTYSKEIYKTERIWAKSFDEKLVPISLVYRQDKFEKFKNPLLVYGYGSYGYSIDANFQSDIVSLLDRGFVYAIIHVRGGQELGRDWYENGRLMAKKNTFSDFIFGTEYLLTQGYGKKNHVYAQGGSAGGLLMGAIINIRPDLYYGVHAAVPFVDVLTTMLDETLPLTTAEYEQWGNPNETTAYHYIKSYSPYDNIKEQDYPNLLVTTGYHDSQVQYWEPLKWVAKLRDHNKSKNKILIRVDMGAGHSGVTGRFAKTYERASEYSFFVWLEKNNAS